MRLKPVFLAVFTIIFFAACNFTEEIYFNADGSGKMNIAFDGSEMMQMIPENDSIATDQVIDSTLVFKDFLIEKKDSIAKLPLEEQANLKKLEPFSMHIQVDATLGIMNFEMFTDFMNVSDVNDAFNTFQNASAIGPSGGNQMPKNTGNEATKVDYTYDGTVFSRKASIRDQELFQQSIDSLQSAEMFLSSSTYTFKYHFPKRVRSTNIEEATFSMDGRTMIYEVNFLDMMKDPGSIQIEVELEE